MSDHRGAQSQQLGEGQPGITQFRSTATQRLDPLAHNGQAVTVPPADRELIFRITLPNVPNSLFRSFGAALTLPEPICVDRNDERRDGGNSGDVSAEVWW
jgi:hypothetical protein